MKTGGRIAVLLHLIDEAYDRQAWHGTNLRGSIRGMTEEHAAWRPGPARHSAWEIIIHAAYWKYAVRRRLTGEKRGSFPLSGSNWFPQPEGSTGRSWKGDIALLEGEHRRLRAAIASDVPGLRDAVRDGETGVLVPFGDSAALSAKLLALLGNPAERERMSRNAIRYAASFTWDNAADTTLGVLERECERRSSAS